MGRSTSLWHGYKSPSVLKWDRFWGDSHISIKDYVEEALEEQEKEFNRLQICKRIAQARFEEVWPKEEASVHRWIVDEYGKPDWEEMYGPDNYYEREVRKVYKDMFIKFWQEKV